jgi:hypothetical protein
MEKEAAKKDREIERLNAELKSVDVAKKLELKVKGQVHENHARI